MHTPDKAQPIYRTEDNELLGYVLQRNHAWVALTIFGYPLGTAASYDEAIQIVNARGLSSLAETWQYYDENEEDWFNCSIIEATKNSLTLRITDYGHPNVLQTFTLHEPSMRTIRKRD